MTRYLWLLVVPGGFVIAAWLGLRWLVHMLQDIAAADASQIRGYRYVPGMEKADESLQIKGAKRRDQAKDIHREAHRIESGAEKSGAESEARLRLVRR